MYPAAAAARERPGPAPSAQGLAALRRRSAAALGDIRPAVPERDDTAGRRGVVAAVVLQAAVGVAGPAIEFHDHPVLPVEDVPVDAPAALHGRSLAFSGRQAMGPLHVSHVPVFQRGVHPGGDIPSACMISARQRILARISALWRSRTGKVSRRWQARARSDLTYSKLAASSARSSTVSSIIVRGGSSQGSRASMIRPDRWIAIPAICRTRWDSGMVTCRALLRLSTAPS